MTDGTDTITHPLEKVVRSPSPSPSLTHERNDLTEYCNNISLRESAPFPSLYEDHRSESFYRTVSDVSISSECPTLSDCTTFPDNLILPDSAAFLFPTQGWITQRYEKEGKRTENGLYNAYSTSIEDELYRSGPTVDIEVAPKEFDVVECDICGKKFTGKYISLSNTHVFPRAKLICS